MASELRSCLWVLEEKVAVGGWRWRGNRAGGGHLNCLGEWQERDRSQKRAIITRKNREAAQGWHGSQMVQLYGGRGLRGDGRKGRAARPWFLLWLSGCL